MKLDLKFTPLIFSIYFFFIYICFFSLGYSLITWKSLSDVTVLAVFLFLLAHCIGCTFGSSVKFRLRRFPRVVLKKKFFRFSYTFLVMNILFSLYLMKQKYGGIEYIISHAFLIREEVIAGNPFLPFYISYINSLNQAYFALSLVVFYHNKHYKYPVLFFINIIVCDLLTFGRVGTLFAVFMAVGLYVFVKGKKFINIKSLLSVLVVFFVINLSRLIRGGGDNFSSSIAHVNSYLKFELPSWTNGILSNYLYFFSSPVALSEYFETEELFKSEFGQRLFTPLHNLFYRLMGEERINTIDPFSYVPYKTNIYTVIRDVHSDTGSLGILIFPIIIGFLFSYLSKSENIITQAIFAMFISIVCFYPLYNALSFGMFIISILYLFLLTFISKVET